MVIVFVAVAAATATAAMAGICRRFVDLALGFLASSALLVVEDQGFQRKAGAGGIPGGQQLAKRLDAGNVVSIHARHC